MRLWYEETEGETRPESLGTTVGLRKHAVTWMKNAARTAQIKKRLAEMRLEVELRRQLNHTLQRERQWRTFAANAQNLYDRYDNATLIIFY